MQLLAEFPNSYRFQTNTLETTSNFASSKQHFDMILTKPKKPVKQAEFTIQETSHGTWTYRFGKNGIQYKEYRSHAKLFDLPLVSIASGINPDTKRMATAEGFIAIGNRAKGFIAIGQFCQGYISIGQFCTARIFGIGQFTFAPIAIGQFSLAVFGLGQMGASLSGIYQIGISLVGGIGQSIINVFG